jgi:branched-chain amino acid transport system permease protein
MMTTIWSGLTVGSVYGLVAIGYTLTFIGCAAFNFAQASLVMVGVYGAYLGLQSWHLPVLAVIVLGGGFVAILSVAVERLAIAPVRSHDAMLITTVGAATIIDGIAQQISGSQPLMVPFFTGNAPSTVLGGRVLPAQIWLIALVLVIGIGLAVFTRRTLHGKAGLAVSADKDAARLYGISTRKYAIGTFLLAGLLAGVMGVFVAPITTAFSTLSSEIALKGFVALAFGGFGSFAGATVGGLVVGLVEAFAARYLGANYQTLTVFALLLATLLLLPSGIFGRARTRTV